MDDAVHIVTLLVCHSVQVRLKLRDLFSDVAYAFAIVELLNKSKYPFLRDWKSVPS